MGDLALPHVDGSRRGLDDGDCIHCGVSGSLEGEECPVRLRAKAPTRDPMLRELVYNVASEAHRLGLIERAP